MKKEAEKQVNKQAELNEVFCYLKQNATTNFLARFSTKNKKDEFKDNYNVYETSYGNTKLTIRFDLETYPDEVPDFYVGCQKLQRYIMCKFTEKGFNSNVITLSVKEMLSTLCLKDNKRSRAEIRQDLKILQRTTVDFEEEIRRKTVSGTFNIISNWKWSAGHIKIEIPQILVDTLNKYGGIMSYPLSNFAANNRALLNFSINDKIAELLTKGNSVLSCQKLYECAVEAGLQSYEHISDKKVRKSFTAAIVKPIEKALNAGKFYKWKYRKSVEHSTFYDWTNDYIELEGKNLPPIQKEDKKTEEVV